MKMMKSLSAIVIFISCIVLVSCTGAKLSNIQEDKSYIGRSLQNVLIAGIADLKRDRILFEKTFIKKFNEYGIKATSLSSISYQNKITRKTALKLGYDAIFVTKLIDVNNEEITTTINRPLDMEPKIESLPELFYRREKHDTVKTKYVMENKLYDSYTGKLIWKARSDTVNSGSMNKNIESVSNAVMKNLYDLKIINK
ncbi:MAG: hypothetical protein ABFD50_20520 [Smithella sp.]